MCAHDTTDDDSFLTCMCYSVIRISQNITWHCMCLMLIANNGQVSCIET
jgi:hypothetical protein